MSTQGTLFIVATPIGNNDDITRRATFTLQQADVVICEEAKVGARVLFNHRITKDILELNEHNEAEQTELCLEMLRQGKTLALISDCGTPLLADPGESLVAKAVAEGISVVPIPGVNSVVTGLMASGLSMNGFTFAGFLSRDPEQRIKQLTLLANETRTIALLETPYRLLPLLEAAAEVIPERKAYLGCNLTMSSETHHYGTSTELLEQFRDKKFKGEFVFCFAGLPSEAEPVETPERWKVQQRRSGGFDREEQASDSIGIADRPLRRRRPVEVDGAEESEQTDTPKDESHNETSYGGGERRSGGDGERRSYGGGERRSGGDGERRSYGGGERRSGGDGERRSYGGGERRSGGDGERRSYGGGERRSGGDGERRSYGGGERRSGGDGERRSYGGGGERRSGGDGERRSYGGGGERRSGGDGERRSYGGGGERRSGGDGERRSYGGGGERRSGGDGERRSYGGGERRSGGDGERRSYGGGERRSGGDGERRSYGGGERRSGGGGSRFGGGRSGGGGSRFGGGRRNR